MQITRRDKTLLRRTEMRSRIKMTLAKRLLQEANCLLEEYYRQPIEEVMTDLRIRCFIDKNAHDPIQLLYGLHFSRLFYQVKDEPAVRLRDAIARFVDGGYGRCLHCGNEIPSEWLIRSPLLDYCSACMVKEKPSLRAAEERETSLEFSTG